MALMLWRLVTLLLAALSMAVTFCHVMAMPVRLSWEPALWLQTTVLGGLYRFFGSVGPIVDVGAIVASFVLVWLLIGRRSARYFAIAGTALLALALAVWFMVVAPMNTVMGSWSTEFVPPDFEAVRQRWEWGHAGIAAIKVAGFVALLLSVLIDTRRVQPEAETLAP
ncbi:MAG: hypothetical protein WD044_02820 [Dongiaceae bacterium]